MFGRKKPLPPGVIEAHDDYAVVSVGQSFVSSSVAQTLCLFAQIGPDAALKHVHSSLAALAVLGGTEIDELLNTIKDAFLSADGIEGLTGRTLVEYRTECLRILDQAFATRDAAEKWTRSR